MNTYYKYTKYFGLNSIKDCYLRLSTPSTLNDPFEARLNEDIERNITTAFEQETIFSSGFRGELSPELIRRIIVNSINTTINDFGIVALSETPRNLLMWAHYADEHQGICIGFKPDLFHPINNKRIVDSTIESYTPVKVNYDSIRPQVIENIIDPRDIKKAHIRQQLITKSNDWMYEKEHRCIIPIISADRFKLLGEEPDTSIINEFIKNRELTEVEDAVFEGEAISDLAILYSHDKDGIFLKKVNSSKIDSIYFGCRMEQSKKRELINAVTAEKSELKHIKLYECNVSKSNFELQINRLHPNNDDFKS